MKITSASVYLVNWPFTRPIQHNLAKINFTENLIVELRDDNNLSGYGEGVPRQYVTGETIEAALNSLKNNLLPSLLGRRVDPDQSLGFLGKILPAT